MRLNNTKIKRWKNLVKAFIKQYKFNIDIALDRSNYCSWRTEQEFVREYAKKWCKKAAQESSLLLEKVIINLFSNTLKALYLEHLVGIMTQPFTDMVLVAERIK